MENTTKEVIKEKFVCSKEGSIAIAEYTFNNCMLECFINGKLLKTEKMDIDMYEKIKDNTIRGKLSNGFECRLYNVLEDNTEIEKTYTVNKDINNYKIMAKGKNDKTFKGIQGATKDNKLVLGGNVFYHEILWNISKDQANKELDKAKEKFKDYQFKIIKL